MSTTQPTAARPGPRTALWTFLASSFALFMAGLDNLVVTTALPSIKEDLGADISELEWTVNGYTLSFAVLLMLGAALGDRFGRRKVFASGIAIFTVASALAAIAPNTGTLIAARAIQGAGAAAILPLSLTILTRAVSPEKRPLALGLWGGVNGLAVALGPLVGGAIVDSGSWQWIFLLNVPIGLVLVPLTRLKVEESYGPNSRLDLVGTTLVSLGMLGVVFGLVRGQEAGWGSAQIVGSIAAGVALLAAFVVWESRTEQPMLPLTMFRDRGFTALTFSGLLMFAGVFGSIFLLTQYFQGVQGFSPLGAGLRILPWTAMPVLIAPLAGPLAAKIGGRPLVVTGMAMSAAGLAWFAAIASTDVSYAAQIPALLLCGIGMSLYFIPTASLMMSIVRQELHGVASGTNNAMRELGGVFGVAVLASVFSSNGGYASGQDFVDGLVPALWVGAAIAMVGAVTAALIPRGLGRTVAKSADTETVTAAAPEKVGVAA
ncbi:DHA2 family efflux MFS transporter permease subunit [Yinghuangia seranimata]|uniref:DHA2 family efflux MFS transporter permease subunit n=1 Tax=Yinghuangia seranimata TaxID=408067 RepID=UPI00248B3BAB|nr:DHA2 family efflux MFS transporter permease subunit [Yinghuangia seranimata]MDI2126909.1 DHA2 family efflux MFS transporter permease subunit [Yinghuangia seranimata]